MTALAIDQEEAHPYGIFTLLAQFAFIGAKNKKVDRYIPIEEIRYALNRGLAGKCNVNAVIDEYLAKEAAQSTIRMAETDMATMKEGRHVSRIQRRHLIRF